jgi:ribosomal protein L30/L7E
VRQEQPRARAPAEVPPDIAERVRALGLARPEVTVRLDHGA